MTTNDILKALDVLVPNPKCSLNYEKDYELLIAVMLSAQSTDARVNMVTKELFKYDISELAELDVLKIEDMIKSVGTQKRKAQYVKEICRRLLAETEGKVPHNREFVESLPGIGHKTCNVVFAEIFGDATIAVDTHVSRVSRRLGWASEDDDVLKIEKKLQNIFPQNCWSKLHLQLVLFGRHHCTSRNPECEICPFNKTICKSPLK